jgi:hypothetical protein
MSLANKIEWRPSKDELLIRLADEIRAASERYVLDSDDEPYAPDQKLEMVTIIAEGMNKQLKARLSKEQLSRLVADIIDGTWQKPVDSKPGPQLVLPQVVHTTMQLVNKLGVK